MTETVRHIRRALRIHAEQFDPIEPGQRGAVVERMGNKARTIWTAGDVRVAVEHIGVGSELIADFLIEAEQVAIVDTGKHTIAAQLTHAIIVITRRHA